MSARHRERLREGCQVSVLGGRGPGPHVSAVLGQGGCVRPGRPPSRLLGHIHLLLPDLLPRLGLCAGPGACPPPLPTPAPAEQDSPLLVQGRPAAKSVRGGARMARFPGTLMGQGCGPVPRGAPVPTVAKPGIQRDWPRCRRDPPSSAKTQVTQRAAVGLAASALITFMWQVGCGTE